MISKIIDLYKIFKAYFIRTISCTKAECTFNIPEISSFTKEQKIAFDQMIDFLANMVEKYGDRIPKSDAETLSRKTA